MKKVVGYILLSIFFFVSILVLYYNIKNAGWYFFFSMLICIAFGAIAVAGIYLINKKPKKESFRERFYKNQSKIRELQKDSEWLIQEIYK